MFEHGFLQRHGGKLVIVAGLGGLVLGAGGLCLSHLIISSPAESPTRMAEFCLPVTNEAVPTLNVSAMQPTPTHSLRLIQAIGILLPLFAGLLRLTTDPSSKIGEHANVLLLFGVYGLTVAGSFAAIGGILSDTAPILKVSLIFVIGAFGVIGGAASMILKELSVTTERDDGEGDGEPFGPDRGDGPVESPETGADESLELEPSSERGSDDGAVESPESNDGNPEEATSCEDGSDPDIGESQNERE